MLLEDAHGGGSHTAVKVYGYCHAFQRWFHLDTGFEPNGANGVATAAIITAVSDTTVTPASQTPENREYRTYHILGIDRVAFVGGTDTNIFAACSTF